MSGSESKTMSSHEPQCADAVLMIKPAAFNYNPQTAASNRMQKQEVDSATPAQALDEFTRLAEALRAEGVRVCVAQDSAEPPKPDALFPNNWVSFHTDGTVVLYPLLALNRRPERRREIIAVAAKDLGFEVRKVLDLTQHESQSEFLEGTGSLVLDRVHRIAYACRSPRTHPRLVEEWSQAMGYEPVVFDALDQNGAPYYHTNVMLCIGQRAVILGAEAIEPADRTRVLERLRASGREIIEIDRSAVERFAGNMLELATWDEALGDCTVLVMSAAARAALSPQQYLRLSGCADTVLAVPVPTIERLGGGSVRCMLAEVFTAS
jgi:hypothetical protein